MSKIKKRTVTVQLDVEADERLTDEEMADDIAKRVVAMQETAPYRYAYGPAWWVRRVDAHQVTPTT